ncbi:helix-turn-helix domain-containing protein [Streptosporangium sp. NPDC050855]|uniref:helix-turn-helix domain-containing protein n=1 Tax=Streptosporangium sp. NPDC050855 TaxID=3366194 RepID=UPI00379EA6E3
MSTAQTITDEPMWGKAEIASYLNVSEYKVRTLVERYRLPVFDIGGELRAHRSEFMDWLKTRKVAQH